MIQNPIMAWKIYVLASSTHLSYNFFKIMNLKCTILRYLASLILSTVVIYSIVIVAGILVQITIFRQRNCIYNLDFNGNFNKSICHLEKMIFMSEPIDFKLKKELLQKTDIKFDKSLVLESLEQNILSHWDTWGKFQQSWTNRAYKTFKDLEKYIVMYLIRNYWQSLSDKFSYLSMDEFYDQNEIKIDKIKQYKYQMS